MRVFAVGLAAAVLALLSPSTSRAQQTSPYSISVYNEGPGFRLGHLPLTIHPGIAAELGYDSNVFYLPSNAVGSGLLRLRAHLDLATLPPQNFEGDNSSVDPKVDFRLSAQAEYREYLSSDEAVRSQRSVNVLGSADLSILPRGPFTLRISDVYVHTVDPRNEEVDCNLDPKNCNFARDYNRAAVLVTYRWARLEIGAGDYFQFNFWETPDLRFGNSYGDEGQLFVRYKILSQTLLSVVARVGWVHYAQETPSIDSIPLRVLAGASTLFTTWLGASANIGYGNSFSKSGQSFDSVIANADLRFLLPRGVRITLGFDRDFFDSIFATEYVDDRVFVAFEMPLIAHLTAHLDAGVRFRDYGTLIPASVVGGTAYTNDAGQPISSRTDQIYDAHVELSARATSWLSFSVNYNLTADETDFAIAHPDPTPVSYIKHSVFGRIDIAY